MSHHGSRLLLVIATGAALLAGLPSAARAWDAAPGPRAAPAHDGGHCVTAAQVEHARHYAARRDGTVSFAVLDECGRLVGDHRFRVHLSASVVKVMLLTAYLRRHDVRHDALSGDERHMLGPMIKESDNDDANRVYGIVGSRGLLEVAHDAHMRHFTSSPVWGASEITAGDQARFIGRLQNYLPRRHEDYALGLMARVITAQRWGIPRLRLPGWKVRIKGGWSPQVGGGWRVNQVARLEHGPRRLSLAILTADDPDFAYGRETIKGVGKRLLRDYRGKR